MLQSTFVEIRYKDGATDLTTVLLLVHQERSSRSTLLEIKASRLEQRVNLHHTLGGDFA